TPGAFEPAASRGGRLLQPAPRDSHCRAAGASVLARSGSGRYRYGTRPHLFALPETRTGRERGVPNTDQRYSRSSRDLQWIPLSVGAKSFGEPSNAANGSMAVTKGQAG